MAANKRITRGPAKTRFGYGFPSGDLAGAAHRLGNFYWIWSRGVARSRCRKESYGDRWAGPHAPRAYPARPGQLVNTFLRWGPRILKEIQILNVFYR